MLHLFDDCSDDEIAKRHRFSELRSMYDAIYYRNGKKPLVPKTKNDIVKAIRNYEYSIARAKMFK